MGEEIYVKRDGSALNELEATSSFLSTVLLGFFHSRIARKVTAGSKFFLEFGVDLKESAGDTESDGAGLTGNAAAFGSGFHVVAPVHAKMNEWALDEDFKYWASQILFEIASIDGDFAFPGGKPDSSDRAFASPSSIILMRRCHRLVLILLNVQGLWVLGLVWVFAAGINLQLLKQCLAKLCLRSHSPDSLFN